MKSRSTIHENETDMNKMDKRNIDESFLILGVVLFVGGAVGYITGQLEQIPRIGALALIFMGVGASMKQMK